MYFTGNCNYLISPCGSGNSPLGNLAIQSCPSPLGKSPYFICVVNVGKHNYIQASFIMICEMSFYLWNRPDLEKVRANLSLYKTKRLLMIRLN